ncbi:hypothetical protein GM418_14265 [Maribellus comscasis]|uniref:Uncharacterized protein n=1 Tax=Maribellus comscasis TaxID=2681766 RepID=A0A6I6JUN8_9BACT|nr:hypothetical protein [Maribellus comscasis]QGY44790.1 hypothetical protein GM418_14265 [Maribellus comscasis]
MKFKNLMVLLPLFSYLQVLSQKESADIDTTQIPVQLILNMPKLFDIEYSYHSPVEQTFVSRDGDSFKTNSYNSRVLSMNLNYPLLQTTKGFRLMLSSQYSYFEMPGAELTTEQTSLTYPMPNHTSYARLSVLGSQRLKIGTRNLVLVSRLSMTGLQFWSLDQFTGIVSASFPFKNTQQGSFAVGLFLLFPQSYYPFTVIPSFSYSKKLDNNFILDVSFPLHFQMHYLYNDKFNIKGGCKLVQYGNLRYNDVGYSSMDLDVFEPKFAFFGASEMRLSKMVWLSAEMGYQRKLSSKVVEHGNNIDDYLYKSKSYGSFYGSVGLFLRPSFKKILNR